MSIRDAIINATRQTLSSYLAPELVETLTDEIVHRMAPEMESALSALAGFEMGRAAGPARVRGATQAAGKKAPKARVRKDVATDDEATDSALPPAHVVVHHNGNGGGEPAPTHLS